MMNLSKLRSHILLLSLVALVSLSCICQAIDNKSSEFEKPKSAREQLAPPKLFDFARFKQLFHKKYGTIAEELARQKLFFARAFMAFLSLVNHKYYKSTHYMKVNDLSDWTQNEISSLYVRKSAKESQAAAEQSMPRRRRVRPESKLPVAAEQEAANLEDIESKLRELKDLHHNEPGYAEILGELKDERSASKRRKRQANSKRDQLSVDDLVGSPDDVEPRSSKLVDRVPSNNPDYEVPELLSYGSDDDDSMPKPMSKTESAVIAAYKGASFISGLVSGAINMLMSTTEPAKTIDPSAPDEVFIDHRGSKCLTPVKSQGRCGSCYIFSTLALYEWQYCKETGALVQFSEQYPIDCGARLGMLGCNGGQETTVGEFCGSYGVELAVQYPYRRKADSCPYEPHVPPSAMGYLKVEVPTLRTIYSHQWESFLEVTPILAGFGVPSDFHGYGGGVDVGLKCKEENGHSMLIVGSGREDGIEYWLIRNSYGPSWGLKGHYKLAKSADHCILESGLGWVLDPPADTKVFGDYNKLRNGKYVREHVEKNKFKFSNLFGVNYFSGQPAATKAPDSNSNIVTPKSR